MTDPCVTEATCPACDKPIVTDASGQPDDCVRCGCTVVSLEWLNLAMHSSRPVEDGLVEELRAYRGGTTEWRDLMDRAADEIENAYHDITRLQATASDLATENATQASELSALKGEIERRDAALKAADNALRNHACHGGPTIPCTRAAYQCQLECGREAGDALLLVEQALTPEKGK